MIQPPAAWAVDKSQDWSIILCCVCWILTLPSKYCSRNLDIVHFWASHEFLRNCLFCTSKFDELRDGLLYNPVVMCGHFSYRVWNQLIVHENLHIHSYLKHCIPLVRRQVLGQFQKLKSPFSHFRKASCALYWLWKTLRFSVRFFFIFLFKCLSQTSYFACSQVNPSWFPWFRHLPHLSEARNSERCHHVRAPGAG